MIINITFMHLYTVLCTLNSLFFLVLWIAVDEGRRQIFRAWTGNAPYKAIIYVYSIS